MPLDSLHVLLCSNSLLLEQLLGGIAPLTLLLNDDGRLIDQLLVDGFELGIADRVRLVLHLELAFEPLNISLLLGND